MLCDKSIDRRSNIIGGGHRSIVTILLRLTVSLQLFLSLHHHLLLLLLHQPTSVQSHLNQINPLKDHLTNLNSYEVIIPQRIDENEIPFPKHEQYLVRRHKRSFYDDEQTNERTNDTNKMTYRLNAFGRSLLLHLTIDEDFVVEGLRVQHMSENETWFGDDDLFENNRHCFRSGHVDGDPNSVVVLSACDNLAGVIHSSSGHYFIEPLGNDKNIKGKKMGTEEENAGMPHIIYRWKAGAAAAVYGDDDDMKDAAPRHFDFIDDTWTSRQNDRRHRRSESEMNRRKKRSLSKERYVEVMVAADHEMKRFHGDDLEHYLLTLMAIVASIYRDQSIGNAIKIVVVKVVVLESELAGKMISKNAATTLRGFCEWQKEVNVINDEDPRHHDTAVLLTKHDICRSNQKCDTLGLAELGTMCDLQRSCSIIKDNGLSAAFTIAHELGHVFSLRHDDECSHFKNKSSDSFHIMAPTLDHETKYWSWSECSRSKMTEFLDAGYGECLNDLPTSAKVFPVLNVDPNGRLQLPGNVYTVDQQCAHIYEPNSVRCPYMPVCTRLWCTNPNYERTGCKTQHMPWADGTLCSSPGAIESLWCYRGQCVSRKILEPRNGGWGSWSPYGVCSRTCGGGIKQSTRLCNNPEPENGGNYCTGRRIKYKSCNHKDCAKGLTDFREHQCASFNGKHFNINGLTPDVKWAAKYSGIEPTDRCKLFCRVASSTAYYQLTDKVIDGTKCSLDTTDVCVMGQCRRAGCDNRLGSNTTKDKCGICGGDNSNCRQIKDEYPENARVAYGYNRVTRIPRGSTNLDLRQYSPINSKDDDTYLALKNTTGHFILNGDFIVSAFHKEIHLHGTILEYSGSGSIVERINATNELTEDLDVYVLTVGELKYQQNIQWQYTVRISATELSAASEKMYMWSRNTLNWTKCSHLCQGRKVRKVVCISSRSAAIVSDQHCFALARKPPDAVKSCHNKCRLSWKVVSQSDCTALCQERGLSYRDVKCQKEVMDRSHSSVVSTFVSPEHCHQLRDQQPIAAVECIGLCSSVRWAYTSWSECSRPCGGGDQSRNAYCVDEIGRKVSYDSCKMQRKVTAQKCNMVSCPHWVTADWTACSVTCGNGWRYRTVECQQGQTSVIRTRCSPGDEPETKRECNAGLCPSWDAGKWGQCSATCGKGIQQRVVKCRSINGAIVDDGACDAGTRPRTDSTCRIETCITTAITTFPVHVENKEIHQTTSVTLWRTGSWTECSMSCGVGSRQRYVSCRDLEGNIASDSFCEHLPKPPSVEPCKDRPCGQWRTGDWTYCSVTCGRGHETRYVACVTLEELEEQVISSTSQCDVTVKPPTERICNRQDCLQEKHFDILTISSNRVDGTVHWRAGPWSPCSSTCESGIQMRRVVCQDERGQSDNCDPGTQPHDQQSCNMGSCPYWNHGEWGQCDVTCGGGAQQRIVHCQLPNGDILPDANCLEFTPPRKQPCGLSSCPGSTPPRAHAHWQKGHWSSCSMSCGKGLKKRLVDCINDNGIKVSDHLCRMQRPKAMSWCHKGRCPFWSISAWSECSVTCGAGVRRRSIQCIRGRDRETESERCDHLEKPVVEETCTIRKCEQFYWDVGNWSECSHPCSFESRSRKVFCVEMSSGNEVNVSFCKEMEKPDSLKECSVAPCSNIWITSDWTRCSMSCDNGIQKRAVSCRTLAREGWLLPGHVNVLACNQTERPTSERNCSYGNCSSSYHWQTTSWSQCSKTCGFGRAYRELVCIDINGSKESLDNCDPSLQPEISRPCYMGPCYSTSCQQVKQYTAWKADGQFNLLIHGKLIPIFCSQMHRSHPKEYLSLIADENENYSEIYDKRLSRPNSCPAINETCEKCFRSNLPSAGVTKFSKVRLNVTSLQIIGNDFSFATTKGKKPVPYGTAGDCYSRMGNCPQGKFKITLNGTNFRVAPDSEWQTSGYKTSQRISISLDRQTVKGQCGGHCGRCLPNGHLRLEILT